MNDIRANKTKLPIGIEDFKEIRTDGFYYVDKTGLIKELLENWVKVNLFTRPRRFGKSLNMSMLKYFFEEGNNSQLFAGLQISGETQLCNEFMGKFPVISISLKGIEGETFDDAKDMIRMMIGNEAKRFSALAESSKLDDNEKTQYSSLSRVDDRGVYNMPDVVLANSLLTLTSLLHRHYSQKVIVLIDEYDVPLDKSYKNGYYDQMVDFIRSLFGCALKTNDNLQMAVLTGCLRISKESIFTGLNNFKIYSISDKRFDEHFGFTDKEVSELLKYYGLSDHLPEMKDWYDGYQFGGTDVYCPWDVINYADQLRSDSKAAPESYWINSSGNDIVRRLIDKTESATVRSDIEKLVAGESINKEIHMDLTYKDIDKSINNLWSVLYTTGYLTQSGKPDGNVYTLRIPNLEIRQIYTKQIYEWFNNSIVKDGECVGTFCDALEKGDSDTVERSFNDYLAKTISIRDTFVKKPMKENFYHGILLGLVSYKDSWAVSSNKESGEGYSDIIIEITDKNIGIVIEVKYPDDQDLNEGCAKALEQIKQQKYDKALRDDGCNKIIEYGIACSKKKCKVRVEVS